MSELRPDGTLNVWRLIASQWVTAPPINPRRDPEVERRYLAERDAYFKALEEADREEEQTDEQHKKGEPAART